MKPSRIIPFYYKASRSFLREDITIATLVTSNRFEVLVRLVQQYQGPISVAIHVTDSPQRRVPLLKALHELYTGTPNLEEYLDVHLVLDVFERQFNTWRNIARFFAAHRTDLVMMLDVDFALCTDFRSRIHDAARSEVMEKVRQGTAALVIPAFEFTTYEEGLNQSAFPSNKRELLSLVDEGRLGMFHAAWQPGHNITNYKRYYTASPGEVYKVVGYQQAYEPYVIFRNAGTPWCDERFIGYGGNKAACLFELYLSGIDFFVLSDDFIIHQSHAYPTQARRQERKYNRKTYTEFREETCLRYLRYFLSEKTMDTIRSHNLQSECRKIKGFARVAAEASSLIPLDNTSPLIRRH
ncbi:glycosyl-transferase for dystroglycan-domain-containing protein [Gautieria morchelliformis]|nr:glycosyl-transferase for dystroglycan-domain-containing protein [Gautieria morchelliformis]